MKEINIEQICIITNHKMATKIVKHAKSLGITGATISIGKGCISSRLLNYIGLSDIRKEIIYMISPSEVSERVLKSLNEKFEFYKPHHGIAFTTTVCKAVGSKGIIQNKIEKEEDELMYNQISIIVDKGNAENVVDAAMLAGAKGGTIINARGSGIHETSKIFSIEIEPEKEIVLIISKKEETDKIVDTIREKINIDVPGNGIIYVQELNSVYGLYKNNI